MGIMEFVGIRLQPIESGLPIVNDHEDYPGGKSSDAKILIIRKDRSNSIDFIITGYLIDPDDKSGLFWLEHAYNEVRFEFNQVSHWADLPVLGE